MAPRDIDDAVRRRGHRGFAAKADAGRDRRLGPRAIGRQGRVEEVLPRRAVVALVGSGRPGVRRVPGRRLARVEPRGVDDVALAHRERRPAAQPGQPGRVQCPGWRERLAAIRRPGDYECSTDRPAARPIRLPNRVRGQRAAPAHRTSARRPRCRSRGRPRRTSGRDRRSRPRRRWSRRRSSPPR